MTPWRKWSDPVPERHLGPLTDDERFEAFVDRYGLGDVADYSDSVPLVAPHVEIFKGGNMLQITTSDGTTHQVEFDRSCVLSVKRLVEVGPGASDWQEFVLTDVTGIHTADVPEAGSVEDPGRTADELHAHLAGLERDALVAEAHVRGVENPHQTKSVVLVEEIFARITAEPEAA